MADDRTLACSVVEVRVYEAGEPHHDGWLPDSSADQLCAFGGAESPAWVHPLDARYVRFQVPGRSKTSTLPTFWTACETCEALIRSGDDDALAQRYFVTDIWHQLPGKAAVVVAAFRRADIGAQPLGG